jgi:hypothetical protein
MSTLDHTYGPTCHLARNEVSFGETDDEDDIPQIRQQYFFKSDPIDDLSVVPTTTGSDSKNVKHPLRPFSASDNFALEEAWLSLSPVKWNKKNKKHDKNKHILQLRRQPTDAPASGSSSKKNEDKADNLLEGESSKTSGGKSEDKEDRHSIRHARAEAAELAKAEKVKYRFSLSPKKEPQDSKNDRSSGYGLEGSPSGKAFAQDGAQDSDAEGGQQSIDQGDGTLEDVASDTDEQKSKEHRLFEEHGKSPEHQEYEKHLRQQHGMHSDTLQVVDQGVKKDRFWRRPRTPSPSSSYRDKGKQKETDALSNNDTISISYGPDSLIPIATGRRQKDTATLPSTSDGAVYPTQSGEIGTTGQPFLKFDAKPDQTLHPAKSPPRASSENLGDIGALPRTEDDDFIQTEPIVTAGCKAHRKLKAESDVPVGVSRLHLVQLPTLQMRPLYWSPVHDIATVTRGTWFYKDTMYPVEPAVANQLEFGYRELRPWSKTWNDELNSAMEVGAAGEEKIVHQLWPKNEVLKKAPTRKDETHVSTNPYCAAMCFHGEMAAEGKVDLGEGVDESNVITKKYSSAQVIYKDARSAFILKPTLQPSAYYGRKPLQKIKRGIQVGIHVVRGFDWKSWHRLHPTKIAAPVKKVVGKAVVSGDAESMKKSACPACQLHNERPKVTDLCLVIHGIGQKLSERRASFNFTHAINAVRRSVHMELADEAVKKVLRPDLGGIMLLPINWRSNLSFEHGGPMTSPDQQKPSATFSLKDITPDSISGVRNLISDVILDIPMYMSADHKPKMINAVVSEANRVYRLWCKNNPGFHEQGRVHLIAHSLGSAMAVDILSKQPTLVPKLDLKSKKINNKHFDFNCSQLFLAGSPVGFFFLTEKARLLPRRGRNKIGIDDGSTSDESITGEAGKLGCLAVDNVYNIMHYNDPIAYRLNPTVDAQYAASLKNAQVPSATVSFFQSLGKAMRYITPGVSPSGDLAVGEVSRPAAVSRLPSQLELEVHDFTQEELAEKKFCLLNENGQVDWFLSSGGGPLEIQYISMLSAHSSYWVSPDFIRLIVTECGREPGKSHTLPNMRARKVGHKST